MAVRTHIKIADETEILVSSLRRCCICFSLNQDFSVKKGQIAHLDKNSANSSFDNLVFLCFDHHDEYDSTTRQSKGVLINEVKEYRSRLYRRVAEIHKKPDDEYSFLQAAKDGHPNAALALLRINIEYYLVTLASASYVMAGFDTTMQEIVTELARKGAITPREESLLSKMVDILDYAACNENVDSKLVNWALEGGPILLKVLDTKLVMPYELEF